MSGTRVFAALALLLSFAAATVHADMAGAQKAYAEGKAKVAAKDYKAAIEAYTRSLAEEPRYIWSRRERATAHYLSGNKAAALADYGAYLAVNPSDKATAAFYRKIGGGAPASTALAAAGAKPAAAGKEKRPRVGIRLFGGYNTYAMTDFNGLFKSSGSSGSTVSGGPINGGLSYGGVLGFRVIQPLLIDLDFDMLSASSTYKSSSSSSSAFYSSSSEQTVDYNFPLLWIGPAFYWVKPRLFGNVDLRLGGGLGWVSMGGSVKSTYKSSSTMNFFGTTSTSSSSSSSTTTVSGSGFGFKFGTGFDLFMGRSFCLSTDLGYRLASIAQVKDEKGNVWKKYDPATGTATGDLPLDYSGIYAKAGVGMWF